MADKKKEYTLTNFGIERLEKAEGISEKGPWVRFKFYITNPKSKGNQFTYFAGVTKPESWPHDGVKVASMTFTITEDGKYAGDCNVKKIIYDQTSKPPPAEEDPFAEAPSQASSAAPSTMPNEGIGKECSVCTSYAMELAKAMIANGFNGDQVQESLPLMCDAVGTQGFHLYLHLKAYMEKERAIKD